MIEKEMKNLAWNTFKQTGNIDTFMELIKLENITKDNNQNQIYNGQNNEK